MLELIDQYGGSLLSFYFLVDESFLITYNGTILSNGLLYPRHDYASEWTPLSVLITPGQVTVSTLTSGDVTYYLPSIVDTEGKIYKIFASNAVSLPSGADIGDIVIQGTISFSHVIAS